MNGTTYEPRDQPLPGVKEGVIIQNGTEHRVKWRYASTDEDLEIWLVDVPADYDWLFLDEAGHPREPTIRDPDSPAMGGFVFKPARTKRDSIKPDVLQIGGWIMRDVTELQES